MSTFPRVKKGHIALGALCVAFAGLAATMLPRVAYGIFDCYTLTMQNCMNPMGTGCGCSAATENPCLEKGRHGIEIAQVMKSAPGTGTVDPPMQDSTQPEHCHRDHTCLADVPIALCPGNMGRACKLNPMTTSPWIDDFKWIPQGEQCQ